MATRFHLTNAGAAPISPAFDPGWEQTGQADRVLLLPKAFESVLQVLADGTAITVPVTTTQDILCRQFVSVPLPAQRIIGTISLVLRVFEGLAGANVTLAAVARIVSQDGGTARGTLFSVFSTDTTFPLAVSAATRIVNAAALTALTTQPGDRLVVEVGGTATIPAASSYTMRFGNNNAADFALTTALTTDLNPWVEFSQDFYAGLPNNYHAIRAGDGMSVTQGGR